MSTVDLIVAGGGPAGLATALHAVRRGMSVIVVEPRRTPIDKACGEGLMPGAVEALRALDVVVEGRPLAGIRYLDGNAVAEARFGHGTGIGARRTLLHEALNERATRSGVLIERAHVRDVRQYDGRVVVDGQSARYLVAADGLHSPIRRALGLETRARGIARYGVRRHYPCAPWTDFVEVHWTPTCEVYVTPVDEQLVGVAVLGPRGVDIDDALTMLPALRARLDGCTPVDADRGAGPLRQRARSRVAGRVLLVGDAGGYVDALTGEGIRLALDEAALAVDCVARDDADAYDAEWRRTTRSYRRLTGGLLIAARRGRTRRMIVPAAARFPRTFARTVDSLAGRRTDGQEPPRSGDRLPEQHDSVDTYHPDS